MDSTPHPTPIKPSASKLPIKRKTPHDQFDFPAFHDPLPSSIVTLDFDDPTIPPPFKFHRIWTEPDEIRFLQGLLDSSADGLCFPRDLSIFYRRFSSSTPQPYTKSQLSEKLRRLRKKFRVLSSRLSRGLDASLLSTHDRALYHLSAKLWGPEFAASSPFGIKTSPSAADDQDHVHSNLVGVKVSFSPDLSLDSYALLNPDHGISHGNRNNAHDNMSEVNVDYDFGDAGGGSGGAGEGGNVKASGGERTGGVGGRIVGVVARSVLDVFHECFKEVLARQRSVCSDSSRGWSSQKRDLETRWRRQQLAELDVLASRLRLVLDSSLKGKRSV